MAKMIDVPYGIFKRLCEASGVNPHQVSKHTGIPTSTLTAWKQGKIEPGVERLYRLARFFEVPMEYFVVERDVPLYRGGKKKNEDDD